MRSDLTVKCRGCLAEDPEMHTIFDLLAHDLTLANILSETTSIQVYESEEISPYLCMNCTEIVLGFYNFKVQFVRNQIYFQNQFIELQNNPLESLNEELPEEIVSVKDSEVVEDTNDINKKLPTLNSDDNVASYESLPPLIPIGKGTKNMIENSVIDMQAKPEVGEFTVQNELVQLIESVVFCCKRCNEEYLLKDDFLSHMSSEHSETKVNASKFTKKALVKLPLAKVKVESTDGDFKLDNYDIKENGQKCKVCNTLVSKAEYVSHLSEHKIHICSCGARFLRKSHLVNHEMSVHSNERNFVCEYCNKAFKTRQSLTKHIRYHTHPRSEICHICGQVSNDRSVLNAHIKLKHFPTKDFQCSYCGLKFPLKSTLFKHIGRLHMPNRARNFSCSICNMTYFDLSTLNRHISVKHSSQSVKVKCEYCGKTFTTKGNLYKHLRVTHRYESVSLTNDGSILVQKGAQPLEAPPGNNVINSVLGHGV